MDRDDAAKVAEILRANPDGISRAGLMAWSRLRIAPDLTDDQLDAALARLGPTVSIEGGFIRLVTPAVAGAAVATGTKGTTGTTGAAASGSGAEGEPPAGGEPPVEWEAGPKSGAAAGGWTGAGGSTGQPEDRPPADFSTVSLLDRPSSSTGSAPAPPAWVAGSRPRRSIRGLMTIAAFVVIGVIAFLGRSGSDGSSAGATSVPSDPRGSIAAAGELVVGSCFVVPVATTFSEVEIRPCDAPHDGEVAAIWDYQQIGSAYPTEAEWQAGVDARCQAAVESYAGLKIDGQSELTYSWFYPAEDAWAQGSRTIQCFLAPVAGSLTKSYRASP
jgi:Septum formation